MSLKIFLKILNYYKKRGQCIFLTLSSLNLALLIMAQRHDYLIKWLAFCKSVLSVSLAKKISQIRQEWGDYSFKIQGGKSSFVWKTGIVPIQTKKHKPKRKSEYRSSFFLFPFINFYTLTQPPLNWRLSNRKQFIQRMDSGNCVVLKVKFVFFSF